MSGMVVGKEKVQNPPMVVSNRGSVSTVSLTYSDSHPFSLFLPFASHPLSATSLKLSKAQLQSY